MIKTNKFFQSYQHGEKFISIFRFIFFLGLMVSVYNLEKPRGFYYPFGILDYFNIVINTQGQILCLKFFLLIFLFFSAVGFLTRFSILISTLSLLTLITAIYSHLYNPINQYMPSNYNLIFYVMLILMFSPGISILSLDNYIFKSSNSVTSPIQAQTSAWPRYFIISLLGLVYLAAFFAKIRSGAWTFLNGQNLQIYFAEFGMFRQSHTLLWLSQQNGLMHLASASILFFELFAIVGFFTKKLRWAFVIYGVLFHAFTYLLFGIDYVSTYFWIYFVFIDLDKIYNKKLTFNFLFKS